MGAKKDALNEVAIEYITFMIYLKTELHSLQILQKQRFS